METLKAIYRGELHVECVHLSSSSVIDTDAPIDNCGRGEAFSPTDLLVASLASCILTIMGIKAQSASIDITGTEIYAEKTMNVEPRRIGKIKLTIKMPNRAYSSKQRIVLERIVESCPVYLSLHPDIEKEITFIWGE